MSILEYNGGSVVAMAGKDCVAIATDLRFGVRNVTHACNFPKVFQMGPRMFVGLPGLLTDTQTVHQKLQFRANLFKLREERELTYPVAMSMLSNILYERRFGPFFVQPIVATLDEKTGKPQIGELDLIGDIADSAEDFLVGGTSTDQLYGMCEALWRPNMEPDDLFETISQSLMNAFDRDAAAGWGADVWIIEKNKVTKKTIKTRMD